MHAWQINTQERTGIFHECEQSSRCIDPIMRGTEVHTAADRDVTGPNGREEPYELN